VLVIHESPEMRNAMTQLIESWGHDVRSTGRGDDGLAVALAWRPHAICLDVKKPLATGVEVAHRITAAFAHEKDRPVLVGLVPFAPSRQHEMTRGAGFEGFLVNPERIEWLREIIDGGAASSTSTAVPHFRNRVASRDGGAFLDGGAYRRGR
jgi:CheY-like chemotaxis protein